MEALFSVGRYRHRQLRSHSDAARCRNVLDSASICRYKDIHLTENGGDEVE